MKRPVFILLISSFCLAACQKRLSNSELADRHLQKAVSFFDNNETDSAKNQIDSLNALYPDELQPRKSARVLLVKINLREQQQLLEEAEKQLPAQQHSFDSIMKFFVLDKNVTYQTSGNYIIKSQQYTQGTRLKASVGEDGKLLITSIYEGTASSLAHNRYILSASGSFVESDTVTDDGYNYRFSYDGLAVEQVSHKDGNENIIAFVQAHLNESIKVTLHGESRKYDFWLSDTNKKSIIQAAEFSEILTRLLNTKRTIDVAQKKIAMYEEELSAE